MCLKAFIVSAGYASSSGLSRADIWSDSFTEQEGACLQRDVGEKQLFHLAARSVHPSPAALNRADALSGFFPWRMSTARPSRRETRSVWQLGLFRHYRYRRLDYLVGGGEEGW